MSASECVNMKYNSTLCQNYDMDIVNQSRSISCIGYFIPYRILCQYLLNRLFAYGIICHEVSGMEYDKIATGNRAYEIRRNKNLKQEDISNAIGIAQSSYSRFETGQYNMPIDELVKLCNVLDVSVSWIIGEDSISDMTDEERRIMESFKRFLKRTRKK